LKDVSLVFIFVLTFSFQSLFPNYAKSLISRWRSPLPNFEPLITINKHKLQTLLFCYFIQHLRYHHID